MKYQLNELKVENIDLSNTSRFLRGTTRTKTINDTDDYKRYTRFDTKDSLLSPIKSPLSKITFTTERFEFSSIERGASAKNKSRLINNKSPLNLKKGELSDNSKLDVKQNNNNLIQSQEIYTSKENHERAIINTSVNMNDIKDESKKEKPKEKHKKTFSNVGIISKNILLN